MDHRQHGTSDDDDPRTRSTASAQRGGSPRATGHFETLKPLGEGAMGVVHLARDVVLRRQVALKSLLPAMQRQPALLSRFVAEMQITAKLDHPNIVPVYGVEERGDGALAYAMKLVEGRDLDALISETKERLEKRQPLDARTSLEGRLDVFTKVCDAVAYAHDRGVIHRDLKPGNIMIGAFNEVYVMDWGIARHIGPAGREEELGADIYQPSEAEPETRTKRQAVKTNVGATLGTPLYMSPEQAAGESDALDGRSDVYALGAILQELVTFELAVAGETVMQVFANVVVGRRRPMTSATPGAVIPKEIVAIVDKACAPRAADRYATASALAEDVRRYLRGEAVSAKPDDALQRLGRFIGKHRMATAFVVLVVGVLGAGATGGVWLLERARVVEQEMRGLRIAEVQATSALRTQTLDDELKGFERELARLAGAAAVALVTNERTATPIPPSRFVAGEGAPEGLVDSSFYGGKVSFLELATTIAPGTDAGMAESQTAAFQSLRGTIVAAMIDALPRGVRPASPTDALARLADPGGPIVRVTLTTPEGVRAVLPGAGGGSDAADGRADPLYERARSADGVVWGTAEAETKTIPCAMAIRGMAGQVLGVIRFDVDPQRTMADLLSATTDDPRVAGLIVDGAGKVVSPPRDAKGPDYDASLLESPRLREAIARGESGYVELDSKAGRVVVTYQKMTAADWHFVTITPVDGDAAKPVAAAPVADGGGVSVPNARRPASSAAAPARAPEPPPPALSAAPSASAASSASAAPSASAPPSAAPPVPPGPLPRANPFDPWKAYELKRPR